MYIYRCILGYRMYNRLLRRNRDKGKRDREKEREREKGREEEIEEKRLMI